MNLRTLGAWTTAGVAFWASLGSLDITGDEAQVVRVAMLPGLGQLAACVVMAISCWPRLRLPRGLAVAAARPARPAIGSGDSFLPLYGLAVLVLPYLPWLPDWPAVPARLRGTRPPPRVADCREPGRVVRPRHRRPRHRAW